MPTQLLISQLVEIVQGKLLHPGTASHCGHVNTDTRTIQPGQTFIALQGEQHDGHQFIGDAIQKQAAVVITEKDFVIPTPCHSAVIRVDSTLVALERWGSCHSQQFATTKIAITGSMGKTTTKELTAHILASFFPTLRTPKSFNNNIGIPLTLLELEAKHKFAVVEIGGNHLGEIEHLSKILAPHIAIITCVAPCHLEGFGSLAGVEQAKSEILTGVSAPGLLITNGDDPACCRIASRYQNCTILFGLERGDIIAKNIRSTPECLDFEVVANIKPEDLGVQNRDIKKPGGSCHPLSATGADGKKSGWEFLMASFQHAIPFHIPVHGRHNISNILAAIVTASYLGLTVEQIQQALAQVHLPKMRLEISETVGITFINDAYNANPQAMAAALDFLQEYPHRRRIAVLGSMRELGNESAYWHHWLGSQTVGKTDWLITIGQEASDIANGALQAGFTKDNVQHFVQPEEASKAILHILQRGDVILFKASRRLQLEEIHHKIREKLGITEF